MEKNKNKYIFLESERLVVKHKVRRKGKLHFRRRKYQAACKEYWPWEQDNSEDKRISRLGKSAKYSAVLLLSHEVRPFHAREGVQCPSSPSEMSPHSSLLLRTFPTGTMICITNAEKTNYLSSTSTIPCNQSSPITHPHPHSLWHSLLLFLSHLPHPDTSRKIHAYQNICHKWPFFVYLQARQREQLILGEKTCFI